MDSPRSSTPLSLGSSSTDKSQGVTLARVCPGIKRYVTTECEEVEIRKMLKDILVDCTDNPQESFDESGRTKLFDDCLTKVIPICDLVKDSLEAYGKTSGKKGLYPLFVTAANTALFFLKDLEIEHVRRADASHAVYFHLNDPKTLQQIHQGHTMHRKLDVLLVSKSDIPGLDGSLKNLLALTTNPPKDAFQWRGVRTFVKFKRTTKPMEPPPSSYEKADSQSTSQLGRRSENLMDQRAKVQAVYYAAEMFTAHAGRLHVVGIIIVDDMLYLSRYDRQGVIQCSGLNIIKDLPLFLVLLFAMQRFKDQHWGLNPDVDPNFGSQPEVHETTLRGEGGREISVTLELSDKKQMHYSLNDWGTNVFSAKINDAEDDLVIEVSWRESVRVSEPDILGKVYDIAKYNDDVKGHVPMVLSSKKFEDTSTAKIRERLGLTTGGSRVLYMMMFRKLKPITELDGNRFLCAWWATVKCHLALWKNGIYHRDISPRNLMYYEDGEKIVGVLNDFDLASTDDSVTAMQRTGTVPFMAVDLLTEKGIRGEQKHLYQHDAQSFIWVLIWISLQYEDGNLHGRHPKLDKWPELDAVQCGELRTSFLFLGTWLELLPGKGHEGNWELAKKGIVSLLNLAYSRSFSVDPQTLDIDTAFEKLLKNLDPYPLRS